MPVHYVEQLLVRKIRPLGSESGDWKRGYGGE